jgi:hypothetical protein
MFVLLKGVVNKSQNEVNCRFECVGTEVMNFLLIKSLKDYRY